MPYFFDIKIRFMACHECKKVLFTILFPPLMKIVTALVFLQSSMTNILSLVVPKASSLTIPAWPNFSGDSSEKRGTILPPVAIAIN